LGNFGSFPNSPDLYRGSKTAKAVVADGTARERFLGTEKPGGSLVNQVGLLAFLVTNTIRYFMLSELMQSLFKKINSSYILF
jgi:hypothetical protein